MTSWRKAELSTYHFHRVFKAVTGVTPRAYAVANRAQRMREELTRNGATVTDVIYESGFNSSGRFYESSNEVLGMTPTDYRDFVHHQTIQKYRYILAILRGQSQEGNRKRAIARNCVRQQN